MNFAVFHALYPPPPPLFLAISFILSYDLEMSLCNLQMKIGLQKFAVLVLLALLSSLQNVFGIRFVIDREECFSHNIEYEGDTLHISFVVIKVDGAWHYTHDGVDLVVSFHVSLLKFFGLLPIKKKNCFVKFVSFLIFFPLVHLSTSKISLVYISHMIDRANYNSLVLYP